MDHRRDIVTSLVETFRERLETAGGELVGPLDEQAAADQIGEMVSSDNTLYVAPQCATAWPAVLRGRTIDTIVGADVATVRDQPFGLTSARLAVAETGSVLLDERSLDDRAVSLMTQTLIVLCSVVHLAPSLDEAAPVLREIAQSHGSYATLITGPSRTADIERQLAVGVQGPGRLIVMLVDSSATRATPEPTVSGRG